MKITALIMAGGRGERFWPKSRAKLPKQFLSLADDGETMIQKTVNRLRSIVSIEDVYVATNASFKDLVLEQLTGIPEENVLCEPVARNTAPCIGLGAMHIRKKYDDAVMIVLPSDAMIQQEEVFRALLKQAIEVALQEKALVTLGITPTSPNTGYGYIQYDCEQKLKNFEAYSVRRFVEKPNLEKAKEYLASGDFLWNSGMFIWRVSDILSQLKAFLPEQYARLETIAQAIGCENEQEVLKYEFENMTGVSIDYGVMEKAERIIVMPAAFDWDDVGSWLAMERLSPVDANGNLFTGDIISIDTRNCTVQTSNKLIALVGMEDVVVINTDDVVMVCSKKNVGSIPKVLAELRNAGRTELI